MEEHCYIVLYDLCKPTRDYASLYRALKQYSFWGKITESAWAIVTTQTYVEIRDNLKQFIDADDRLMVIKSGQSAAWTKAIASDQWLKENLIK